MDGGLNSKLPAPVLPSGTVTFLFTDIEGSTRLLQQLGDQYAELLADQRCILRAAFENWGGQEVDTQGDSFFVSFPLATDAIGAVVEVQRSLADHPWPEGTSVRLRMGLHTGEPGLAEEGYVGIDVHRAARIGSIGHGGQVLLSETTAALLRDELPEGVNLLDLGEHRLKDIQRPEPISQLVIPGLSSDFPTLKSLDARPNNLPTQPTPFIGRKVELDALDELISDPEVCLVTILGAGGMGKTRLALAVAEEQLLATESANGKEAPRFPNGVFFVSLAPLDSTDHLLSTIAKAVSFQFYQGVEPNKQMLDYFRDKGTLLIMDNFEHLLDGAQVLAEILKAAPRVKALATSREKLNLRGETVYSLQGMTFPTNGFEADTARSKIEDGYSAVKLFVQSARRMHPGIEFTVDDLRNVALICQLVDGMPLGVELAAAWIEMLSPEEIASEIQDNLDFLEAERRDAPERHQSIRAVFDYTWKMVGDEEREVFEKLSIFRGGFTRKAAERVTGASLKVINALANKSLIQRAQDGRYEIHELLRQYAQEKLGRDPEKKDQLRDRHSEYFAEFVDQREAAIIDGDQGETLTEMDNIRAGWQWAVTREKIPDIRAQMLSLFWLYEFQGWYREAEASFEWAADLLRMEVPVGDKGIVFGYMLAFLAVFFERVGSYEKGLQFLRESRAILRQLDAQQESAHANMLAFHLGITTDYEEQKKSLNESLSTYGDLGIRWGMVNALMYLGLSALANNEYERAEKYFREQLKISRETNNRRGISWSYIGLGRLAQVQEDYVHAQRYFTDSLAASKEIGYQFNIFLNLCDLGNNAILLEDYETAQECFEEAFILGENSGNQIWMVESINGLGDIALAMGELNEAKKHYQEALSKYQDLDQQVAIGSVLCDLGNLALALDDAQEARDRYQSALEIGVNAQDEVLCLEVLAGLAAMLNAAGDAERAVELAVITVNHPNISTLTREKTKKLVEELDASLPPKVFSAAHERGKSLELMPTVKNWLTELAK